MLFLHTYDARQVFNLTDKIFAFSRFVKSPDFLYLFKKYEKVADENFRQRDVY